MTFPSLFPQLCHQANHCMSQTGNHRPSFQTMALVFYSLLSYFHDRRYSQLIQKVLLEEALPPWQTLLSSQPLLHSHLFQIQLLSGCTRLTLVRVWCTHAALLSPAVRQHAQRVPWKTVNPKSTSGKIILQDEGAINRFSDKQKLRQLIASRCALQEMLKGVFQAEMKGH